MSRKAQLEKAVEHLRAGNLQMAAELCNASLKRYPGDAHFLCLSARANLAMRNFDVATRRIEEAIRRFPDFATAHETYGDLQLVRGRAKEALTAYETAVRLDPTNPVTHDKIERARADMESSNRGAATSRNRRRMRFAREIESARQAEQAGDLKAAEMIYRDVLKKDPDHIEAARLLAGIAVQYERFREAEIFLKRVLENAPDYTRAWVDLVNVQRELDKFEDAIESASHVLRLEPDNPNSHILYAGAIGTAGDHEGAIEAFRAALDIAPDKAGAISGIAHHQKTLGEQDTAIESYRRAIEVKPDHAEAYWSLANLKTFRFRDDEVEAMQRLLNLEDLPDESRAQLHNALGLEFEGRKDYDQAFEHFSACNAVRRKHETYDPVDTESTHDRLISLSTSEFFEKHAGVPDAPVTPIFVVGLPRSGSTLIEQILASHSRVDGTHELGDLSRAVRAVRGERKRRDRFPEVLDKLHQDDWRRIGEEYLERTKIFRSGAPFFVDKNPNNFVYAGVLKLAIPNAKIINARRHPLDSCFGSYKQLFASGQPFTYDFVELGEYYLQYERLMNHWHEVLPGFVLDVHYEHVVADLETQVQRMLDFCGLPLEKACLRYYETERAVKTASSEQVRQPIYQGSLGRWRRYEKHLDLWQEELADIVESLPDSVRNAGL